MIVRRMRPEEFNVTINLVNRYGYEAAEKVPAIEEQWDDNSVLETVRTYSTQIQYCWFNAYDNSRPVGFIAGFLSECPWNHKIITANIEFLYLMESHRSMDNFRDLLKCFEEWALSCGAREITSGDIGIDPDRITKLFSHFGFKSGVWMGKELNNG